jgi:hypothetical protein
MSTKSEVIQYFKDNPEASPVAVAGMFGVAKGNIYNYRNEALGKKSLKELTGGRLERDEAGFTRRVRKRFTQDDLIKMSEDLRDKVEKVEAAPAPVVLGHPLFSLMRMALLPTHYEGYIRGQIVGSLAGYNSIPPSEIQMYVDELASLPDAR